LRETGLDSRVLQEVEPLVNAMGFDVVELGLRRRRGQTQVYVTVYRPAGVSIDDCAAVSRNIHPRLELIEELGDIALEVSSPGLNRTLKGPREYAIFRGRRVRVLLDDDPQWRNGRILEASGETVTLEMDGEARAVRVGEIRRARLEEAEEAVE
jgi:ribosome maturation factor RimP